MCQNCDPDNPNAVLAKGIPVDGDLMTLIDAIGEDSFYAAADLAGYLIAKAHYAGAYVLVQKGEIRAAQVLLEMSSKPGAAQSYSDTVKALRAVVPDSLEGLDS